MLSGELYPTAFQGCNNIKRVSFPKQSALANFYLNRFESAKYSLLSIKLPGGSANIKGSFKKFSNLVEIYTTEAQKRKMDASELEKYDVNTDYSAKNSVIIPEE